MDYVNKKYMLSKSVDTNQHLRDLIKPYVNPDLLCLEQKLVIKDGLEKNLDVSIYAKSEFNIEQMKEILYGMQEGIDVSIYAKPYFDVYQMRQIRFGLLRNIDVAQYAIQGLSDIEMQQKRYDLIKKQDKSLTGANIIATMSGA